MREQAILQSDRVYTIQRTPQGVVCNVNGKPLPLRLDLWNHSPTGFEFGYGGSGPAQLALAILADCCGDELAAAYHQAFKWAVIARLPGPGGSLTGTFVRDVLARLQADRAAQQCQNN
jgi:hypothetical protein